MVLGSSELPSVLDDAMEVVSENENLTLVLCSSWRAQRQRIVAAVRHFGKKILNVGLSTEPFSDSTRGVGGNMFVLCVVPFRHSIYHIIPYSLSKNELAAGT